MLSRKGFLHLMFGALLSFMFNWKKIRVKSMDNSAGVFPKTFPITFAERKLQHKTFLPSIKRR